jgi:hypothetical protein
MSTPSDELTVDLDAADAKAAEDANKNGKSGDKTADSGDVTVEKVADQAKPAEKQALTPDEGVEKLRQELADEKAARQAADRRADEATRAEVQARTETQTSQLDLVKGALERVTESNKTLKGRYAEALASQDWSAAADIQLEMSENAAKLIQLEAGKKALENAPKPTPRAPSDPVEQFASSLSPASAAWVRAHPEFVRDQHKNRQMIAAHELALARGHKADTPEYFASVEKTLDITAPVIKTADVSVDDPAATAAQATGGRAAAPAAAPVSRSNNGANGSRPNTVKLTPQEVEIAEMMGMSPEEYARNKVALRKEGKLS